MKRLRERSSAREIVRNGARLVRHLRQARAIRSISLATIAAAAALLALAAAPAKVHNPAQASIPAAKSGENNAANGRRLFKKDGCYECHGFEAQGSPTSGPRLGPDPIPLPALIMYVRKPTGQMPPYTDKVISDKELADIYAFLQSLPHPPPAKTIPLLR